VLEVSSTRLKELGIKWPSSFSLSTPTTATTLGQMRDLTGNDLIASSLSATLNLQLAEGDTNVLASPRIRVRNREKAKIMIGSRVPVITNAVTPVSTGSPVITGSVQYLDVGLKLDVEPDVHLDNEVVIKVGLDVSSIIKEVPNEKSGTLAYEVGTRNASTVLRLKDGETQILAGLISDEERNSASKMPGLGHMPLLGRLFSSHKDDNRKTEIVLSITPHIVGSRRLPDAREVEYWAGTETSLRNNPLLLRPLGTVALSSTDATVGARAVPALAARAAAPGRGTGGTPAIGAIQPTAATQPLALSWQGPNQAKVGDKISLTLNIPSSAAVGSLGFLVGYDPTILKVVDVVEGSLLKQNNQSSNFTKSIDQASGQVLVDLSATATDGANSGGSVATLVFEVTAAAAQSQITVSRIVSSAASGEELAFAAPEPHTLAVLQ
jgi:general secretion pathway protein D